MKVYLDNAATTPIAKEVITEITPYLTDHFGNPSSTHSFGRKTKNAIEITRKKVANLINAENSEIIFTSGGTESDSRSFVPSPGQFSRSLSSNRSWISSMIPRRNNSPKSGRMIGSLALPLISRGIESPTALSSVSHPVIGMLSVNLASRS